MNQKKPMNELERELHYPWGTSLPGPGASLELAPGIKWLRMDLPFALNHINLWLLRDCVDGRQGWSVVDCCISRDESRAQWESIFSNELEGLPILRVIVTHMHPDHIGLAWWLCERWQAPLWISSTDYNAARMGSISTTGFGGDGTARFFASHGLNDEHSLAQIRARMGYYPTMVPAVPPSYRRMMDGDLIATGSAGARLQWRCISGYGHAPEHIALYCEQTRMLISGDMVLPRISTNVSVYDFEPESNPLQLFLASLQRYRELDPDTLTLPSHGKPFRGLHRRLDQLEQHHRERLADVLNACSAGPRSAYEMLEVLFQRKLDMHQTTFAMGESVAHLHALWFDGQLTRHRGDDGIYRFAASAPA